MDPLVESALISAAATFVGVGGTVVVAIVGFRNSRSTNEKTIAAGHADVQRTLDTAREGQFADRYSRALEQLGSEKLDVRSGAIYALEGIARDSVKDHPTVMEVLTAFIRQHSSEQWPPPGHSQTARFTRPDIQAAVTVIGRRDVKRDLPGRPIDLYHAILIRANLNGVDLRHATLSRVDFTGADLRDADLRDANLRDANLRDVRRLDSADLTGVRWAEGAPVPEGWELGTGSDRLERRAAGVSGSEPREAN